MLFAAVLVMLVARAARKDGGVLERNRAFGERFLAGDDPYYDPARGRRIHAPYPPSFVLAAVPIALLPERAARVAWACAQAAALVLLWRLCRSRAREHWPELAPHAGVVLALALLLASRFLLRDTAGGGGNVIFGALAWLGIERALAGRPASGGAALALSLVLKPNLAPLLAVLALRQRGRALVVTATVALALFLLPATTYGLERWLALAREWASGVSAYAMLDDTARASLVPEGLPVAEDGANQSLRETVRRLLAASPEPGAHAVHLVDLGPRAAAWVARALLAALLALSGATLWRARGREAEWLAALAFLPLALLASPITWKAHHVVLLPLFFALAGLALRRDDRPAWLGPGLVAYYLACVLASEELVGKAGKRLLATVGVVTAADVLLVVAGCALAVRAARRARGPASERVADCGPPGAAQGRAGPRASASRTR